MGIPTRFNPLGKNKSGIYGPTEGLVFYSKLNNVNETHAETGQAVTKCGDISNYISNDTIEGINCIHSTNGRYSHFLEYEDTNSLEGNNEISTSVWCYGVDNCENITLYTGWKLLSYINYAASTIYTLFPYTLQTRTYANSWYHTWPNSKTLIKNSWHNIVSTYDGTTLKIYCDGIQVYYTTASFSVKTGSGCKLWILGGDDAGAYFRGYLTALRIYNRALTQSEITQLANEFHPIKAITFNNQNLEFNNDEGAKSKALSFTAPYSGYSFTINSGTLPDGVTFNTSTGVFTYDGTTILEDEDVSLNISCSGRYMTTATATVTLKMRVEHEDDAIVYVSCSSFSPTAETGQTITYSNTSASNFVVYNGIPSYNTGNLVYARLTEPTINQGSNMPRSYSVWLAMTSTSPRYQRGFAIGNCSVGNELSSPNNDGWSLIGGGHSRDYPLGVNARQGEWFHFVQTYSETGELKVYLNGVLKVTVNNANININSTIVSLGAQTNSTNWYFPGYIAGARVYNRVLTQEEVTNLSQEYTPQYTITAQDLNCSFYQKNETFGINYSSAETPTFEIIEGSLPNTISFNTSTGQFSGKGLTDADHTYNLKVKITAPNSTPAECNVVINTYKTARISITGKTFQFYTDGSANDTFNYTSDETVTFALDSGQTLPTGITMNGNQFSSDGSTPVGTYSVVVRGTSANNQVGVTATMTINITANIITISTSTMKFFVDKGVTTKKVKYKTDHYSITPVYSMTGTLPTGITFNASTGEFTSDATQTAAASGSVQVTVASSTGRSTPNTKTIDIVIEMTGNDPIIEEGLTFYMPCNGNRNAEYGQTVPLVAGNEPTFSTVNGISCMTLDGTQDFSDTNTPTYISRSSPRNHPVFSYSLWFKGDPATSNGATLGSVGASWGMGLNGVCCLYYDNGAIRQIQQAHWANIVSSDPYNWHHYVMVVFDNGWGCEMYTYVDGVKITGQTRTYTFNNGNMFSFPKSLDSSGVLHDDNTLTCNMAGLRIYNRVLTQEEVNALHQEFTPTP